MKNLIATISRFARTGHTDRYGWPEFGSLCPRCREPMVRGEKRVVDKTHETLDGRLVVHRRCSDGSYALPHRTWVDSLTRMESAEYFGEGGWPDGS